MRLFIGQLESGDCMMEEYFFDTVKECRDDKVFILIIYDITDNKKRNKFAKFLQGYGNRVQKSAFEARISRKKYTQLLSKVPAYVAKEDSVRIYRISGQGQVTAWGISNDVEQEEIILI